MVCDLWMRRGDRVAAHLSALVAADKTGAEPDPATYYLDPGAEALGVLEPIRNQTMPNIRNLFMPTARMAKGQK